MKIVNRGAALAEDTSTLMSAFDLALKWFGFYVPLPNGPKVKAVYERYVRGTYRRTYKGTAYQRRLEKVIAEGVLVSGTPTGGEVMLWRP